ncbi:hypothetical protein Acr_12g0000200 [Actinidia rufa]|uniref:Uncharacterized protein n=1 Tax=Actinidia rufa TaxID=165716 RepID=A0A7J0FH30_9ERIC|nr:hypothetical protein Acr_12g0000200 [Actinidia rufa]
MVTLHLNNAHLEVAPPQAQLQSHTVDLDTPKDAFPPPTATNILSIFTAPTPASASYSRITDAIG